MSRRRGFTLIEVIVALAIMVTLAAVVLPSVVSSLDRARLDRAQDSLQAIADAVVAFHNDVDRYPATLTQLIDPLDNSARDICHRTIPHSERRNWNGPYIHRVLASGGLPVAIGTAADDFTVITNSGSSDEFMIVVNNVELADAEGLDDHVDGDGSQSSGTIQWTSPDADNFVTLGWVLPFPGC